MQQKITVSFDTVTLNETLHFLSTNYNLEFSYSPLIIPKNAIVTYSAQNKTLTNVLSAILKPHQIDFQLVGKHIVLTRAQMVQPEEKKKPKENKYTISGYISDKENGEALIGATIYNDQTGIGTISNQYGFYSITLTEGKYTLRTSFLGYKPVEKSVWLTEDIKWNAQLGIAEALMKEVLITPETRDSTIVPAMAAQTVVPLQQLVQKSNMLGVDDLLKSLENQPGLNFHGDGSSYFYVRGGNRDQNLILLDEAPIYNPSHMLGLFTPITTEVVKKTTIYKADFPVQYGGRLSSVIDIRTRDGNMEKFSGLLGLGVFSGIVNLEGPFKKERSSYFLSYRRSYFGAFLKAAQPNVQDFYFDDFTAKLNFRFGSQNRLFLTYYAGNDKFLNNGNGSINGLAWGNKSFTARWNHVFDPQLFINTTLYASNYDYKLYTDFNNNIHWNSHISGIHLKSEFTWYLNPKNRYAFGGKIASYFFNPGNYNAPEIGQRNTVSQVNSGELILYAGNRREISNRLTINYGARLTNWFNTGEAFVVNYENGLPTGFEEFAQGERFYNHISLQPRASASYRINKNGYLNLSYSRNIQHINLINNSISPFNSLEVYLPSGPNIKPQAADVYNLGLVQFNNKRNIELNADVYYKKMYHQIGFDYHAQTLLNPLIEGELYQGNGTAYGFEIMLRKTAGQLTGELSYAYSRSTLHIEGLNGNRPYPALQDKPVNLALNLNYAMNARWKASLNMLYNSGNLYTTPTAFYDYKGYQVPVYTEMHNQRLPDYKRVDISTDILLNNPAKNRTEHHLIFSVYNLLNSKNYSFLYLNKTEENDSFLIPVDQLKDHTYTPAYRYIFSIIPSLTYKFYF